MICQLLIDSIFSYHSRKANLQKVQIQFTLPMLWLPFTKPSHALILLARLCWLYHSTTLFSIVGFVVSPAILSYRLQALLRYSVARNISSIPSCPLPSLVFRVSVDMQTILAQPRSETVYRTHVAENDGRGWIHRSAVRPKKRYCAI